MSLIGTVAALSGVGSVIDWFAGKEERKAAATQAQNQMNFQYDMSNTAYQRAVEDMKAAGINPILAAGQGGASTPSGAGYATEKLLDGTAATALQSARTVQDMKESKSREGLNDKTVDLTDQQTKNASKQEKILGYNAEIAETKTEIMKAVKERVKDWMNNDAKGMSKNWKIITDWATEQESNSSWEGFQKNYSPDWGKRVWEGLTK